MTGDLAFYATILGRDGSAPTQCPWCDLSSTEWKADPTKEGGILTYDKLVHYASQIPTPSTPTIIPPIDSPPVIIRTTNLTNNTIPAAIILPTTAPTTPNNTLPPVNLITPTRPSRSKPPDLLMKESPQWQIDPSRCITPLLHLEMGLFNKSWKSMTHYLDDKVELLPIDEQESKKN